MSQDATITDSDYSNYRIPLKTLGTYVEAYYMLGSDALDNGLEEAPDADPAFIIAILTESEKVNNLHNLKCQWRNGWMDRYQNKYLRSSTDQYV